MAKKKNNSSNKKIVHDAYIEGAGIVEYQPITETLEKNYMPYAMSVILSRALPEIDGFKPSHRKLLYTMYKMGLLTGARTKSANVVGQTMKLNPHGDQTIYETMVRLSRGYQALLHPYVDSKGNFGRAYSRDMAYAASRYTEVKLDQICNELFRDIDKDTVEFIPNYDNTMMEPRLLPAIFPSILVNANVGIAVSMASAICPFNLQEVCETAIAYIKNPKCDLSETLKGPDFPGGGFLLQNPSEFEKIYRTGRGSVRVRSRYTYDKAQNCIDITEIPPTTTVEAIMDKIVDLIKANKIKEISDLRDETDLSGLKLTLDLKRGTDPEMLMRRLHRMTALEDAYSCNFNVLVGGTPQVLGVDGILEEWTAFRVECVRRQTCFELDKKKDKLHLLEGLQKIILDIDKAIQIVRNTEEDSEVIPNLMIGFGIDKVQAEFVAEIKLRNLNKEYLLRRTEEIEQLKKDIKELESILSDKRKINQIIIQDLKRVIKIYANPRKTLLIYPEDDVDDAIIEEIPDYQVNLFLSAEGYLKKITPQSLRMSSTHKLKEDDKITTHLELSNNTDLLFFTSNSQVYKTNLSQFGDTKASVMGDYVPAKLNFDENETLVAMAATRDYSGTMLFFFENGKVAKVPLNAYQTKTNRKKLANAYNTKSDLVNCIFQAADREYLLVSNNKKYLLFNSALINTKATRATQGVAVMKLNKNCLLESVSPFNESMLANSHRFRTKSLPARGAALREEDIGEQLTL